MLFETKKIIVNYASTTNFTYKVNEEAKELFKIVREYKLILPGSWKMANDLIALESGYKCSQAQYTDLNELAIVIFEAGKIQGIREERKRKKQVIHSF